MHTNLKNAIVKTMIAGALIVSPLMLMANPVISENCSNLPLNQPCVSDSSVLSFANDAARSAYSYNYITYEKDMHAAASYFTPNGWNNYTKNLTQSDNLQTIISGKMISDATEAGPPTILRSEVINNRYSWKIELPLFITYISAGDFYNQDLIITLYVVRSDNGIAVDNIQSQINNYN